MSNKTEKVIRNIMKNNNLNASRLLKDVITEKISKRMRKVLSDNDKK